MRPLASSALKISSIFFYLNFLIENLKLEIPLGKLTELPSEDLDVFYWSYKARQNPIDFLENGEKAFKKLSNRFLKTLAWNILYDLLGLHIDLDKGYLTLNPILEECSIPILVAGRILTLDLKENIYTFKNHGTPLPIEKILLGKAGREIKEVYLNDRKVLWSVKENYLEILLPQGLKEKISIEIIV